jgi:radical SAM superfamily enzyme YgiQ (UPF0313 family)
MTRVALWDTGFGGVQKDFAGGLGVGLFPGRGGLRGRIVRWMYRRDRRPVALNFASVAAICRRLGLEVAYVRDGFIDADVYVFNPALMTLEHEIAWMREILTRVPSARILVVGAVAWAMPEAFQMPRVAVVRGEVEQLESRWNEALETDGVFEAGTVADLDSLPVPDWSPFAWRKFRVVYDFWRFPTACIQQSRGCTFRCNYCPYIMIESKTRFRSPDAVIDEIRYGQRRYGFESFKFRDPLFGLNRKNVLDLAERLARLPKRIQFSIETRIDLMKDETLRALRDAGLTSITVGIETPSEATLRRYHRQPVSDDRQQAFVRRSRELGIRTVAGFMVGFPDDTVESIRGVLNYARRLNPTFANFNIVTPYPGTAFYGQMQDRIGSRDYSRYSAFEPVLSYEHLTPERVAELHARCFAGFYFRSRYFADNARQLWPSLGRLVPSNRTSSPAPIRRAA